MTKETLTVKNFGPIREAHLDLRKVTVLIGEQASGKSVLAKLVAIFRNAEMLSGETDINGINSFDESTLGEWLKFYNILDYHEYVFTNLVYQNNDYQILVEEDKVKIHFLNRELEIIQKKLQDTENREAELEIKEIESYEIKNYDETINIDAERKNNSETLVRLTSERNKRIYDSIYIPTERIILAFVPSLHNYESSYLNDFASKFEKQRQLKPKFKIIPTNLEYKYERTYDSNKISGEAGFSLELSDASSGIQSLVPLQVVIETMNPLLKHLFIIEEPELNLYPTTQKKLVEYLIEKCTKGDNRLIITTHSPYILTALNNCIQARNTLREHPEHADEVAKLVRPESQIDYEDVMAYFVADGTARSIMNDKNRLIDANALDDVSDELGEIFDRLLDLEMQPA